MRYWGWEEWLMGIICAVTLALVLGILSGLGYNLYDRMNGTSIVRVGYVESRNYVPSSTSVGIGPTMGGNGGVAITTSSKSEEYVLIVNVPDLNSTKAIEVNKSTWAKAKIHQKMTLTFTIGRSGAEYETPTDYKLEN